MGFFDFIDNLEEAARVAADQARKKRQLPADPNEHLKALKEAAKGIKPTPKTIPDRSWLTDAATGTARAVSGIGNKLAGQTADTINKTNQFAGDVGMGMYRSGNTGPALRAAAAGPAMEEMEQEKAVLQNEKTRQEVLRMQREAAEAEKPEALTYEEQGAEEAK